MAIYDMSQNDLDTYANNKRIYETATDKNSDEVRRATAENQKLRNIYGIDSDDYNYEAFSKKYIAGGLKDQSNKYLKRLDSGYKSNYGDQLRADAAAIRNFTYNPDSDPNFKVYADIYARQGKAAQNQTLSELTSISGGRNNSWVSAAVGKVGQVYAQKTADMIPQLAEQAYNKLLQRYNITRDLEETDYQRFNDKFNRNKLLADSFYDRYNTEYDRINNDIALWRQNRNNDLAYDSQKLQYELDKQYLSPERQLALEQLKQQVESGKLSNQQLKIALKYLDDGYSLDNAIKRAQLENFNKGSVKGGNDVTDPGYDETDMADYIAWLNSMNDEKAKKDDEMLYKIDNRNYLVQDLWK